jgi:N-acetylglutamate synthase-like GNAT family acetyltransferase
MEIRQATDKDIQAIIDLLKVSLGEALLQKSETYWRWKHLVNPFGASPVIVAEEGGKIIGVRAFMRWSWRHHGKIVHAVRAVDTATHPDHQGKGIFKKLTLSLLEMCAEQGYQFVFNTPNKNSMPGYLKMGWKLAGRLPVAVRFSKPLSMVRQLAFKRSLENISSFVESETPQQILSRPDFQLVLDQYNATSPGKFRTAHTVESLTWRYVDVPVAKYHVLAIWDDKNLAAAVFYRLKPSRAGLEMRVTDVIAAGEKKFSDFNPSIVKRAKEHGAFFITSSNFIGTRLLSAYIGPQVTVRSIGDFSLGDLEDFNQWSPSLGDMELF